MLCISARQALLHLSCSLSTNLWIYCGEQSVAVAPFIINYSGCIFREYPGPWQVMLRQDSGEYACIAEQPLRYNLVRFCRLAPRASTAKRVSG